MGYFLRKWRHFLQSSPRLGTQGKLIAALNSGKANEKLPLSLFITDKFIDYSCWIRNLLLDVLICSIAVYFWLLFLFWNTAKKYSSSNYGATGKTIQRYYILKHQDYLLYGMPREQPGKMDQIWRSEWLPERAR